MTATKLKFAGMPKDYAGLVAMYPPRQLRHRIDERTSKKSSPNWPATTSRRIRKTISTCCLNCS